MTTTKVSRRHVSDAEIATLRSRFRGPLFRPGDADYDPSDGPGRIGEHYGKFIWNLRDADARPVLIARPSTAADVIALVDFAREGGWHPSVRGGFGASWLEAFPRPLNRPRGSRSSCDASSVRRWKRPA